MDQSWENWPLHSEFGDDEEFLRDIILQPPVTYSGSSLSSSSNEMDGSDWSGKKVHNPSTTLSSNTPGPRTFILSFDKSTIIPATTTQDEDEDEEKEEPRIKSRSCGKSNNNNNNKRSLELPKVKVSSSTKSGKKSRSDSQCMDHIMAERKRRLEIAQKFIALSATIPGLKKTDKTSILCEAINYVKVLQERVKELEEPNKKSKESTLINLKTNEKSVVDVKARVLGNEVLIEMHCEKENGIELKILNHLQNLHLIVTASTVFPFGNSNLGFTIVAQMGDGYKLTVDDLVKTLQQVPLINMRRST
ncbi:unnamed protein product [Trifolium pratense]|uniref:Uncharacterized protein n=1 Tax=Trifolium pratense TaxID=57577 RepID=A0ACB0KWH0_TRIPR|nr:unnamed protein product [Trifolium pratense]